MRRTFLVLIALVACGCSTAPRPTVVPTVLPTPIPTLAPVPFGLDLTALEPDRWANPDRRAVQFPVPDSVIPRHWRTAGPESTRYAIQLRRLSATQIEHCQYYGAGPIIRLEVVVRLSLVEIGTGQVLAESPEFTSEVPPCPSAVTASGGEPREFTMEGILPEDEVIPWLKEVVLPILKSGLVLPVTAGMPLPDVQGAIGTGNTARVIELARWEDPPGEVTSLSISADGTLLAVGTQGDGSLWLRSMVNGAVTTRMDLAGDVFAVAFSPDGQLVAGGVYGAVTLWRTEDGKLLRRSKTGQVRELAFSPDGTRLATNARTSPLQLLDVATGASLWLLAVGADDYAFAFAPGGETLVTVQSKGISIWDLTGEPEGSDASPVAQFDHATAYTKFFCMDYAPDGKSIVTQKDDGAILVLAMPSGKLLHVLGGGTAVAHTLAYSPDGTLIAAGAWDGTIKLWDASAGSLLATLAAHTAGVEDIRFTPDGTLLVSGSKDGTVRVWGVPSAPLG